MPSSTVTLCSDAQIMPLSNVLEWMIELTASLISALSSMMTGVLPAPTPSAGLPEEYAAMHHAGAARRQNDVRFVHQLASQFQAGELDAADDAFRRTRLDRRLVDDARSLRRALLGARMRADEDRVAGLQAQQRLKDRRRRRFVVGDRRDRPIGSAIFLCRTPGLLPARRPSSCCGRHGRYIRWRSGS